MERAGVPFKKIVFVCVNRRPEGEACCAARESEQIASTLKEKIKTLGLARWVRVSKSGCQDVCAQGPNVMVFPEGAWYHHVALADVERIVEDLIQDLPEF